MAMHHPPALAALVEPMGVARTQHGTPCIHVKLLCTCLHAYEAWLAWFAVAECRKVRALFQRVGLIIYKGNCDDHIKYE